MKGQNFVAEASMGVLDVLDNDQELEDGEIIAAGIVVVVQKDGMTTNRVYTTDQERHRAIGLMYEGFKTVESGHTADIPDDRDD